MRRSAQCDKPKKKEKQITMRKKISMEIQIRTDIKQNKNNIVQNL